MSQNQDSRPGKVYLVGAGPGDPRLITVRGVECLARADLVLYDCLVNPAILKYASPSAEVISPGRRDAESAGQEFPREPTSKRLIEGARQGKTVVYLKGGDPNVFGHGADETEALAAAGIPFETVPGVTAALAASSFTEIPITHGEHASAVALVTGREQRRKSGSPLDFGALAEFPGTLIFYMGEGNAQQWSRSLIDRGKSPETPVAIVRRCSWPDQQTVRCTLATVTAVIAERRIEGPTVIMVGDVVSLGPEVSWFADRLLFGQRILLTRPRHQVGKMWQRLVDLGADVIIQPAIRITDPPDWPAVDAALDKLQQYDWLVFSSVNGVRYLLDRLLQNGGDLRSLGQTKLAAIGPATADELGRYHLRADLIPREYRAEALADELARGARGKRFLLARASRGREVLAERISAAGGLVDQIVVYTSSDVDSPEAEVAAAMSAGQIDWITVTSSAIARSLAALLGEQLGKSKLASISPITSGVIRELGFQPTVEAKEYTTEGLIEAILAHQVKPARDTSTNLDTRG